MPCLAVHLAALQSLASDKTRQTWWMNDRSEDGLGRGTNGGSWLFQSRSTTNGAVKDENAATGWWSWQSSDGEAMTSRIVEPQSERKGELLLERKKEWLAGGLKLPGSKLPLQVQTVQYYYGMYINRWLRDGRADTLREDDTKKVKKVGNKLLCAMGIALT